MEKINLKNYKIKKEKSSTHKGADIVFNFLKKYKIDYKKDWGKRLAGRMLHQYKINSQFLLGKIENIEEQLNWFRKNNKPAYKNIKKNITKYIWSSIFKK